MAKAKTLLEKITATQRAAGPTDQVVVGQTYYIRGPRSYYVGRVVAINGPYAVALADASWVPNTGRLSSFMAGEFDSRCRFEPAGDMPNVAVADIFCWPHPLPTERVPA